MSTKGIIIQCHRSDLIDSSWVLAEVSKLQTTLEVVEDMRDASDAKIVELREALAQIAMVAGEGGDDHIQSLALGALNK